MIVTTTFRALVLTFVAGMAAMSSGCSSSSSGDATPAAAAPAVPADTFVFESGTFTSPASSEKYICFTKTLTEDMYIDDISVEHVDTVHHSLLITPLAPEQDGTFECPVLFRTTWLPIFAAGASDARLTVPKGSSFQLKAGQQILLQLHLLNALSADAAHEVKVNLHKTEKTDSAAGIYAFGTSAVTLPPGQVTSIGHDCAPSTDLNIFAVFPHMHLLGKTLTFDMGPDTSSMSEMFKVDPWEFNKQIITPMEMTLHSGDATRTTCSWNNPTDHDVKFGESSNDEMCFFLAFITQYQGPASCVDLSQFPGFMGSGGSGGGGGAGGSGTNPECAMVTANDMGIGGPCTKSGKECGKGLSCSADLDSTNGTSGICIKIGCSATADCGSDATCCAPKQGGGAIKTCLPTACVPSDCTVVP